RERTLGLRTRRGRRFAPATLWPADGSSLVGCATAINPAEYLAAVYEAHAVAGRRSKQGQDGRPDFRLFCQDRLAVADGKGYGGAFRQGHRGTCRFDPRAGDPVASFRRIAFGLAGRGRPAKAHQRNYRGGTSRATDRKRGKRGDRSGAGVGLDQFSDYLRSSSQERL